MTTHDMASGEAARIVAQQTAHKCPDLDRQCFTWDKCFPDRWCRQAPIGHPWGNRPELSAAPTLTALVPIAGNAEWWRGFLRGVAIVRTVRAAWAEESTGVGLLP